MHAITTYKRIREFILLIVTSVNDEGQDLASCLDCFAYRKNKPAAALIGGWVDPMLSLDVWEKRCSLVLCLESKPLSYSGSAVTILTELKQ